MQKLYKYRYYILLGVFTLNLLLCWPGFFQPDSMTQYQQAITGQYSDHHPPMMSFIWHFLDQIHTGQGLMFGLQMLLLYSAVAVFLLTLDQLPDNKQKSILSLILILIPLHPQIQIYAVQIIKDAQFAFGFLLSSAILSFYTIKRSKPSIWVLICLFALLIYSSAVKYQGQFCVIILAVWLGCLLGIDKRLWQKITLGLVCYAVTFASIGFINNLLVPQKSKNYSWQFVKLYDLAALSKSVNKDLIPEFNKTENYTFEKLTSRFKYPAVDPYIYSDDNIFQVNKDQSNMQALYKAWMQNVFTHPVLYFKHRAINLCYTLLSRPGFQLAEAFLDKLTLSTGVYSVIHTAVGFSFYFLMSHFPQVVLCGIYMILALMWWRSAKYAPILFAMSAISLLMVAILFFMSMAGTPRYTYISIIMANFGHVFAYICLMEVREAKEAREAVSKRHELDGALVNVLSNA